MQAPVFAFIVTTQKNCVPMSLTTVGQSPTHQEEQGRPSPTQAGPWLQPLACAVLLEFLARPSSVAPGSRGPGHRQLWSVVIPGENYHQETTGMPANWEAQRGQREGSQATAWKVFSKVFSSCLC